MNHDDVPIGQHNPRPFQFAEQPEPTSSAPSSVQPSSSAPLPQKAETGNSLSDRIKSKAWKVRCDAFEELANLLKSADNAQPDLVVTHAPLFRRYVADPHPGVQEKVLDALVALLSRNAPAIFVSIPDTVAAIIERCVTSMKGSVRGKALDTVLELAKYEGARHSTLQAILDFLAASKPPKATVAGLQTLTTLLSKYGDPTFSVESTVETVEKLALNSTNSAVRAEALNYYREAHRWVKDGLTVHIKRLKAAQQEELAKSFEGSVPGVKKDSPEKVKLPEEKKGEAKNVAEGDTGKSRLAGMKQEESTEEEKEPAKFPVNAQKAEEAVREEGADVLGRFKEEWCSAVMGMTKWSEKREKLEELLQAVSVQKIKPESCTELVNVLKRLIDDTNIIVANTSLKVVGRLSQALGTNFGQYQRHLLHPIIQRFKDRKTAAEADKCLENISVSVRLEDVLEELKEGLADKSPAVRIHLCQWMEKFLLPSATQSSLRAIPSSGLLKALAGLSDEAVGDIREGALNCLGVILAIMGQDSEVQKVVSELSQQKRDKVSAAADAARKQCGDRKPAEEAAAAAPVLPPPPPLLRQSSQKSPKRKPLGGLQKSAASPARVGSAATTPMSSTSGFAAGFAGEKRRVGSKSRSKAREAPMRPVTAQVRPKATEAKEEEAPDDTDKSAAAILPQSVLSGAIAAGWKDRQKAFQELNAWLSANRDKAESASLTIMLWLRNKLKDFKESNQAILKEALETVRTLAGFPSAGKRFASAAVPGLVEKLGDAKWTDMCVQTVLLVGDCAGPGFVAGKVVEKITGSVKNVNLVKAALGLLCKMGEEYSINMLPLKEIVECCKLCLSNANQSVRTAATALLCSIYVSVGEPVRHLLSDLKEATLKSVEAEFAKVAIRSGPSAEECKRQLRGEAVSQQDDTVSAVDALIPRVDIVSQIGSKILNGLAGSGMKQRQEAREQVEKILVASNGRIQAGGLGPLMSALKGRMSEPCKSLAKGFVALVGNLAAAMGPGCKQYSKIILPSLIGNLGDKQNYIRSETVVAMNKFADAAGAELVFNCSGPLLEKENPELRSELLSWLLKHKETLPKSESHSLVKGVVSCLQDRGKEVRGMSESLLELMVPAVGIDVFLDAIQDLKPTVKGTLKLIIEKYSPHELHKAQNLGEEKKDESAPAPISEAEEEKAPPVPVPPHLSAGSPTHRGRTSSQKSFAAHTPRISPGKPGISPPLVVALLGNKEKRAEQERSAKWPVDDPAAEHVEKLKRTIRSVINPGLYDAMFSDNLKRQLDALKAVADSVKDGKELPGIVDLLDLFFKWVTMLLMDQSNTAIAKSALELMRELFHSLSEAKYQLLDFEAAVIFPTLAERSGTNNPAIKDEFRDLIKASCKIYSPSKVCNYLVRALDSKNQRTRVECLSLIKEMTARCGLKVITARDIKTFGKLLAGTGSDPAVKGECVELLDGIHKLKGEAIWSSLGELPDKIKDMLEMKFKQSSGERKVGIVHGKSTKILLPTAAVAPFSSALAAKDQSPSAGSPKLVPGATASSEEPAERRPEPMLSLPVSTPDKLALPSSQQVNDIDGTPNRAAQEERKSDIKDHVESMKIGKVDDCLRLLRTRDISRRVDALVYLNERATSAIDESKTVLIPHMNEMLGVFADILQEVFSKSAADLPVRFTKYFMSVISKICAARALVYEVNREMLSRLLEQLLVNLLWPGLDKLGEHSEGEIIMKALNSTALSLLEKCNPTTVFRVLIELYAKSKGSAYPKLPELVIKCILKLTKVLDSLLPVLDVADLFLCIHEYLTITQGPLATPHDDIGTKIAKTIVSELVKTQKEAIWDPYNRSIAVHAVPDTVVKRWLTLMLNSQSLTGTSGGAAVLRMTMGKELTRNSLRDSKEIASSMKQKLGMAPRRDNCKELKAIFAGLNSQETFSDSIVKLSAYKAQNPECDLSKYFQTCSKAFADHVLSMVEKCSAIPHVLGNI